VVVCKKCQGTGSAVPGVCAGNFPQGQARQYSHFGTRPDRFAETRRSRRDTLPNVDFQHLAQICQQYAGGKISCQGSPQEYRAARYKKREPLNATLLLLKNRNTHPVKPVAQ
jgi:hypothetical protein